MSTVAVRRLLWLAVVLVVVGTGSTVVALRQPPAPRFADERQLYQALHSKSEDEVRAIIGTPETTIQIHPHAQAPFEETWRYPRAYKSPRLNREVPILLYFHDHRVIRIDAIDEGQRRIEP